MVLLWFFFFFTFNGGYFAGRNAQERPKFLFVLTVGQRRIAIDRVQLIGGFTAQIFFVQNALGNFGGMRSFDNVRIFSDPNENLEKKQNKTTNIPN